MSTKPTVVYWNNGISHYIVGRFNAIARRGNLKFEAWWLHDKLPGRDWRVDPEEWEFPARLIPVRRTFGRPLQVPTAELAAVQPSVLVTGYSSPSWVLGICAAVACGARVAFRILPTFDTWIVRSRWKEALKSFLFRGVDGAKVSGRDAAAFAQRYGMPEERMHVVTQSIDVEHYARAREMGEYERARERTRLGLRGCVFVYSGRLWSKKGLDELFEAYGSVRSQCEDTSLLIVGNGVDEERYRKLGDWIPGVVFAGFVQPKMLPTYYALGDVLVFPTLGDPYGLVVEEAMAAGLPVICSEAAGEIKSRLPDGKAGYIVPAANARVLAERMLLLARDRALRSTLGLEAARIVTTKSHEQYAIDFERFIDRLLAAPRRTTTEAVVMRQVGRVLMAARDRSSHPAASIGAGQLPAQAMKLHA